MDISRSVFEQLLSTAKQEAAGPVLNILCQWSQGHPELDNLCKNYFEWLIQTGQYNKAGAVKENQQDFQGAVNLYLKAGLPTKAARLAIDQLEISSNSDSVSRIVASLIKGEFYERVRGSLLLL